MGFDPYHPLPSILDRLDGHAAPVALNNRFEQGRQIEFARRSILADVEKLLNTRPRCHGWEKRFPELDHSILSYGLKDFSGSDLSTEREREELRAAVEAAITRFEPRLDDVRVQLQPFEDAFDNVVRLQIQASIPALSEAISFWTSMAANIGRFHITEEIS